MTCWLAVGEHEALKRDWKGVGVLFHAEGKPTIPSRIYPADGRETSLRRTPFGRHKIFCWLAFRKHEALKGDWKGVVVLFHAEGKPTIPSRLYPADGRETPLRRTPLGGPKCFAG